MKGTFIRERKKIKLKNPILITGLPGIGLIGRLVGRHMIEELSGKKIAELYSHHFPHQVFMTKKGGLRLIKNKFYQIKGKKNDIVVLIGDVQAVSSVGQYEVAGAILDYCEKMKINTVLTVGGYSTGKIEKKNSIYGATGSKELKRKFSKLGVVFGQTKGSIVGAAGLIPALAKLRRMNGICIMGETHGAYVDATAAKNITVLLSKYLGTKINIKKLEKKAKMSEKVLKKIEEEIKKHSVPSPEAGPPEDVSYIR